MISELSQTTWEWMRALRIPVSKRWLRKEMEKHPYYPSLLSLTDTLTAMGIQNKALEIETEQLQELPLPFLAMVGDNSNPFRIITEVPAQPQSPFYKEFKGIVVAAEKPQCFDHPENKLSLQQEKRERWLMVLLSGVMASLSLLAIFFASFSALFSCLIISSVAGIGISVLTVFEWLGIGQEITHRFCPANETTDCSSVIHSNGGHLIKGIGWSDLGMIYFLWQWILLLVTAMGGNSGYYALLTLSAIASVPFVFFSVYYQSRIAKKWCILCLCIVGILVWQCAALLLRNNWFAGLSWINGMLAMLLFAGIAPGWLLFQLMVKNIVQLRKDIAPALRLRNNAKIFMHLLHQQQRIDDRPFIQELQISDGDGPLQLIVACNPYCQPCAEAHQVFDEIAAIHGHSVSISIRFVIPGTDTSERKTKAVNYILQVIDEAAGQPGADSAAVSRKILHHWFSLQDLPDFMRLYPLRESTDPRAQLQQHAVWAKKTFIPFTPAVFVNGYSLPEQYEPRDLPMLINAVLNEEELLNPVS